MLMKFTNHPDAFGKPSCSLLHKNTYILHWGAEKWIFIIPPDFSLCTFPKSSGKQTEEYFSRMFHFPVFPWLSFLRKSSGPLSPLLTFNQGYQQLSTKGDNYINTWITKLYDIAVLLWTTVINSYEPILRIRANSQIRIPAVTDTFNECLVPNWGISDRKSVV